MLRTTLIILTFLTACFANGQTRNYQAISIKPDTTNYKLDTIDVLNSYSLDSLTFLFGRQVSGGIVMLVKDKNGMAIFTSSEQRDSYIMRPTFFKTNNLADNLLILVELGTEYSWGNTVYRLHGRQLQELGFINIAATSSSSNIAPFTKIKVEQNKISFDFTADKVTIDPGGQNQADYKGSAISYLYADNKFKLIKK